MGDLRLQEALHGVGLGQVQRQVPIAVDGGNVGPVAQEVPGGGRRSGLRVRAPPPSPIRPGRPPHASPGDVQVPTGGGHVQGRPALIVRLVHRGALLHQEAHHLQVLVDTGLERGKKRGGRPSALCSSRPTGLPGRTPDRGLGTDPGAKCA